MNGIVVITAIDDTSVYVCMNTRIIITHNYVGEGSQ